MLHKYHTILREFIDFKIVYNFNVYTYIYI